MTACPSVDIVAARDVNETGVWLDRLLNDHAEAQVGVKFVMDQRGWEAVENGTRVGGVTAIFAREWVFVALLAVTEQGRGKSIGRDLMGALEDRARAEGKIGVWLDTYSFQAPDFYESLGYTRCGTIPDYPPGHARHFYAKRLDGQPLDPKDRP